MLTKHNTVQTLLKRACNDIDTLDAELLLAHVIHQSREFVIAHPEYKIPFLKRMRFKKMMKKRAIGYPLAYIVGHKYFYGYDFVVNEHTLIPRPDTEMMVEHVVEHIAEGDTLIDIGTGSGCIPISILKELEKKEIHIECSASDISKEALGIAQQNAKKHKVNVEFKTGSLFEPFKEIKHKDANLYITANLPYLDESWYNESPSIQFEPKTALVAKEEGTALYKELFKQLVDLQVTATILVEIDPRHAEEMKTLTEQIFPNESTTCMQDLQGKDRMMIIKTA